MSAAQIPILFAAVLALSLLGIPRLPSKRGLPRGGSSALSRWALFAWTHPRLAALLRRALYLAVLAAALWIGWLWMGRPDAWAARDAAWAAMRRLWPAPPP